MALYGASAHVCPVVAEEMGEALNNGSFLIVKANENGKMVKCGAGEAAYGVLIAQTPEVLAANDEVTVQISDIAPILCGGAVAKGAKLACDANGKAVTAAGATTDKAADEIIGIALEAGVAGQVISVKLA